MRWKLILKPIKNVKTHLLFEAIILSFFTNIILPINIGKIVKAYFLKRKAKLSMSSVFGSIAIEKIISILGFLIVGIFAVLLITLPGELVKINIQILNGLKISTAVFFLLLILVVLVKKYRKNVAKFIHYVSSKFSKKHSNSMIHFYENFLKGLRFGANKRDLFIIIIIIYSVLIRIIFAFITLSIARGFGIELSLLTFLFIDILVTFAHSIGGHLGIIGTYEAALTYSLLAFGVQREIGLSIALIAGAIFITISLTLGLIYFLKEGLTFKKLQTLKNKIKILKNPIFL